VAERVNAEEVPTSARKIGAFVSVRRLRSESPVLDDLSHLNSRTHPLMRQLQEDEQIVPHRGLCYRLNDLACVLKVRRWRSRSRGPRP
jgi:hypothetical protein